MRRFPASVLHARCLAGILLVVSVADARSQGVRVELKTQANGVDRGAPVRLFAIRLGPTANEFRPGHRFRLDVTSSDFPNYDRNHNTAADPNADATLCVARQTVYHGGAHASKVVLPKIPK